jgi:hypothetical protein
VAGLHEKGAQLDLAGGSGHGNSWSEGARKSAAAG